MSCAAGSVAGYVSGGAKTNTDGCVVCPAGTSSAGGNLTTCTACGTGRVSAAGASECVNVCLVGYKKDDKKCIQCEAGK